METGTGSRVQHNKFGQGVIIAVRLTSYLITFINSGTEEISQDDAGLEITDSVSISNELNEIPDYEKSLERILLRWHGFSEVVPLGDKWKNGKLILQPGDTTLQAKEIPAEAFFHKIVMLRDRLRVLEQHINSHLKLEEEDKVNLQQYITRIYGSLTTFNILFKLKEQQFTGEKSRD
jgi:hypothetical protein